MCNLINIGFCVCVSGDSERSIEFIFLQPINSKWYDDYLHDCGGGVCGAAHGLVDLFEEMLAGCDDVFAFNPGFVDRFQRRFRIGRDKVCD